MKTKRLANILLLSTILITVLTWSFRRGFWGGLLFAAAEAAMVGALADWFAVVALFRHPLGMKWIPHTAIIPKQRQRIIEGITYVVEKEWLSIDYLRQKILDYPLLPKVLLYLENNREELEKRLITVLEAEKVETFLDRLLQMGLTWALDKSQMPEFAELVKKLLVSSVQNYTKKGGFLRRLTKGMGETLDILNYDQAARALINNVQELLRKMQDTDSQEYQFLRRELQDLYQPQSLAIYFSENLKDLCQDESKNVLLEGKIKKIVVYFLERYHSLIGVAVKEKLQDLDEKSFVDSLEVKVGEDLQWIRINGTVIGAIIGTVQYLIRTLI